MAFHSKPPPCKPMPLEKSWASPAPCNREAGSALDRAAQPRLGFPPFPRKLTLSPHRTAGCLRAPCSSSASAAAAQLCRASSLHAALLRACQSERSFSSCICLTWWLLNSNCSETVFRDIHPLLPSSLRAQPSHRTGGEKNVSTLTQVESAAVTQCTKSKIRLYISERDELTKQICFHSWKHTCKSQHAGKGNTPVQKPCLFQLKYET